MRNSRLRILLASLLLALAGGCGSTEQSVRIGLLADCQGPFRGLQEAQLSGAVLPFLRRGGRLAGAIPSDGVTPIDAAGRRVELVLGCMESGEHTVFIEEARRLIETERVDVLVGGASVAARDLALRYPEVVFVSTFWDEQEITLRRPAPNLFRLGPDYGQQVAGLGAHAYRTLGWRSAVVIGGDAPPGWGGAAAFTAEFCALGGTVVDTLYRSPFTGEPDLARAALAIPADGVAAFLTALDDPLHVLGDLAEGLERPATQLVLWPPNLEDDALLQPLARQLDGVTGTSWLPATQPSPVLRAYRERYATAFPGLPPSLADQSWVIGYHNAVEATIAALERLGSSDTRAGLPGELAASSLELPGGRVTLDSNRQAVRDGYLSRIVSKGGTAGLEAVDIVPQVEQSFGGLLSAAPPPGPKSQACRRATPPAWAR